MSDTEEQMAAIYGLPCFKQYSKCMDDLYELSGILALEEASGGVAILVPEAVRKWRRATCYLMAGISDSYHTMTPAQVTKAVRIFECYSDPEPNEEDND